MIFFNEFMIFFKLRLSALQRFMVIYPGIYADEISKIFQIVKNRIYAGMSQNTVFNVCTSQCNYHSFGLCAQLFGFNHS